MTRPLRALAAVALLLATACGGTNGPATGESASTDLSGTVTVFAAASLTESVTELGRAFEVANPSVAVQTSFAGSPSLVAQVRQGAPADLVITADETAMALLQDRLDGEPRLVARNALSIAVEPGNPLGLRSPADLARPGVAVVLGGRDVPVGRAARALLSAEGLELQPVSEEPDVKAVLAKVLLGEADAGIVYATDVMAAGAAVDGIRLPGAVNGYPAGVVRDADGTAGARALLEFLLAQQGQRILGAHGFLPP